MNKQKELACIFSSLSAKSIDYIVLRKHTEIPDGITYDNDMDLLCRRPQRDDIKELFKGLGYQYEMDSALDNSYLYGSFPHDHFRSKEKDMHVDIVYSLSYRSTNRGEWVPAHQSIQASIWEHKVSNDNTLWVHQPAAIDELMHIVCHCIFDKKKVDGYYARRMAVLIRDVDEAALQEFLEHIFFKFTHRLIELLKKGACGDLYHEYISFKDY